MRIRQVKPEFWASLDIARLPRLTRLHFIALWNYADDDGRGIDDHRLIKQMFLLDEDVDAAEIESHQALLEREGRIVRYEVDGRRYFEILKFRDHQYVQKRKDSNYPPVPENHQPASNEVPLPEGDRTATACVGVSVSEGVGVSVAPTKSTRATDHLFEALVEACQIDAATLTTTGRGSVNRALAELRGVNAYPSDIFDRANNYRLRFPDAALTPMALAKHWAACEQPPPPKARPQPPALAALMNGRNTAIETSGRQS